MTDAQTPIVCDMTDAPDSAPERLDEYRRLFRSALLRRERTPTSVRFMFRQADGIESWARDLAARENACCAFMQNTITIAHGTVVWEVTTIDDPIARSMLDLFYDLPEQLDATVEELYHHLIEAGIPIVTTNKGAKTVVTIDEVQSGADGSVTTG